MEAQQYIVELARSLRKEQTDAEDALWHVLRAKRFFGFKFRRQHPIGRYIADFYCKKARLVIEIDGAVHKEVEQKLYDEVREREICERGLNVQRFRNADVLDNLEATLSEIWNHLPFTPSPPCGEGAGGRGERSPRTP